jgi:hypothetical protein
MKPRAETLLGNKLSNYISLILYESEMWSLVPFFLLMKFCQKEKLKIENEIISEGFSLAKQ